MQALCSEKPQRLPSEEDSASGCTLAVSFDIHVRVEDRLGKRMSGKPDKKERAAHGNKDNLRSG